MYRVYIIEGSWQDYYSYYHTFNTKSSACAMAYDLYKDGIQSVKVIDSKGIEVNWSLKNG